MKRLLLKFAAVAVALVAGESVAVAQTVYGLAKTAYGFSTASVELSALSADETAVMTTEFELDGVEEFYAGAGAGDKYYAFLCDDDYATFFCTVNFTTGEVVKINSSSYGLRQPGTSMRGLTYNSTTEKLYGIEPAVDTETNKYVSKIYEVNTTSGELTQVAALEGEYRAIAADGEGGFYVAKAAGSFSPYAAIYYVSEVDGYTTPTEVLVDEDFSIPSSNYNTMVVSDGKIYYQTNNQINLVDLSVKTITLLGTTGSSATSKKALCGMTFTKSSADGEPGAVVDNTHRLLVRTLTYGDSMGEVSIDVDTKKEEYFYDANYNLQRVVEYGREYDTKTKESGDYTLTYLTKYNYGSNGTLDSTVTYQRGLYDFGDKSFKKSTVTTYKYDEQGRLVEEPDGYYTLRHEYDDEGNIVKTEKINSYTNSVVQTLTYSDFYDVNKPTFVESTGPYDSYVYYAFITYDANGNKISELQTKDIDRTEKKQLEEWTYDGTFLTLYTKTTSFESDGTPIEESKTVYEIVDGDSNKIRRTSYSKSGSSWARSGLPKVDEYVEFEDMNLKTATELVAEVVEDTLNTVKLNISIPMIVYETGDCDFAIYRDGSLIATKNIFDIYVESEGFGAASLEYVDSLIYNGDHEYFVQPLINENGGGIAPLAEGEEESTGVGYCISNIAEVTLDTDLPAVTNLKATDKYTNQYNEECVVIEFTNPENMEDFGFISNDLYFTGYQLGDTTTTDPTVEHLDGRYYDDEFEVFVLTRYKFGKALSDTITVNVQTVGIEAVSTVSGATISFDGTNVRLSRNADIAVYSAAGKLVAKEPDTTGISLAHHTPGVYIVCLTADGVTTAHKVVVK